jgi:16S rRNA (cytidine1402-2'-O)-methyltransferase
MTLRSIETLQKVSVIYAEDTRTSGHLLKHHGIETPQRSYHNFNEHKIVDSIIEYLLLGKDAALITDAGTPTISDPGFLLVRACINAGIKVSCLPGATAFVPALAMSGLPSDKFYFEGFLPHKKGRQTRHKFLTTLDCTFILYESPFRLLKCLEELQEFCGADRQACVVREISKVFEEAKTDSVANLISYYSTVGNAKGEIVIVVGGRM